MVAAAPAAPSDAMARLEVAPEKKPKRRPKGYDNQPGGNGNVLSVKVALPLAPGESPPPRTGFPYVTPLKELCLESVAQNFASDPRCIRDGILPPRDIDRLVALLALDLPLELAGELVSDERYWERRARARWRCLDCVPRGRSWKQLYFERNLEDALRAFDQRPRIDGPSEREREAALNHLRRLMTFSKRFARNLRVVNLPAAVPIKALFETTMSCLVSLSLEYRADDVGMSYDPSMFGMKLGDCRALAQAVERAETLVALRLSGNRLDDEKVRMVASGLADNVSVTRLELARNGFGCRGAVSVAKLLGARSVISYLDLTDNRVRGEGAAALADALRRNDSLLLLTLRRNRLGDEGGEALFDALAFASETKTTSVQQLDVGACELGPRSARALAALVERDDALLRVSVAGNFGMGEDPDAGDRLAEAMRKNRTLRELDVRACGFDEETVAAIEEMCAANADASEGDAGGAGRVGNEHFLEDLAAKAP